MRAMLRTASAPRMLRTTTMESPRVLCTASAPRVLRPALCWLPRSFAASLLRSLARAMLRLLWLTPRALASLLPDQRCRRLL